MKLSPKMQEVLEYAKINGPFRVTQWAGRALSDIPCSATLATLEGLSNRGVLKKTRIIGTYDWIYSVISA